MSSPPSPALPHATMGPREPTPKTSRPPRRQNSPAKNKKTHSQPQGGQPRPRMAADTAEGPPEASAPGARPSSTRRWQAEDQTSQRARPAQTPMPGREGRKSWRKKGRGAAARCTTSSSPNPYYGTWQLEGAERHWDVLKGKGEDACGASVGEGWRGDHRAAQVRGAESPTAGAGSGVHSIGTIVKLALIVHGALQRMLFVFVAASRLIPVALH